MAKRPCARPGCAALVVKGYCDECKPTHSARARSEAARPSAAARGYGRRWQKTRIGYLRAHPLAVDYFGDHNGRLYPATELDHIIPHKGDMKLFWDPTNWQGLTKQDHDRKTAMEDGGFGRKSFDVNEDRRSG